ncbi:MAG: glycosyltransferase family 9 protein [Planctomycetia bacterium]|nr:glycosyltransferase family 9 protein [Planctomycetia bacterium]
MSYPALLEINKGHFYADIVSRFDQADIAHLFVKGAKMPVSLMERLGNVDLIMSFVSAADRILSDNLNATGARRVIHYDPFPFGRKDVHIVDHLLQSLDTLGIPYFDNIPRIFLHDEDIHFAEEFIRVGIADPKKKLVAIHPGSGSKKKCWPTERFAALINWLIKEENAHVFVVSGPADKEIIVRLRAEVKDNFTTVDHLSLSKLSAVIKRCNLFIGNDSGITHLAAAVGSNTVSLFGPTDPKIWGPRGESVKILYGKAHCSPCLDDVRKNCFAQTCLENIKVEDVMHEVKQMF